MILLTFKIWTIFASILFPSSVKYDWQQVTETEKYVVYTRKSFKSNFKEVKITGKIDASLDAVINVLSDVDNYPKWIFNCVESFELEDKTDLYYYAKIDLPFPLSDRDMVVHNTTRFDTDGIWHSCSVAQPKTMEEVEDVVRIKHYKSEWKIVNHGNGVDFEYIVSFDPSGAIPGWIMNMVVTKGPIQTIAALEKRSKMIEKDN